MNKKIMTVMVVVLVLLVGGYLVFRSNFGRQVASSVQLPAYNAGGWQGNTVVIGAIALAALAIFLLWKFRGRIASVLGQGTSLVFGIVFAALAFYAMWLDSYLQFIPVAWLAFLAFRCFFLIRENGLIGRGVPQVTQVIWFTPTLLVTGVWLVLFIARMKEI